MENLKKQVGIKAAEFVKSGMVVGLGTGSTAAYFVEELGRRVAEEQLEITGVTTSSVTSEQAKALGIPLASIDEVDYVDLTVDGADEIDSHLNGIKGGGAALLMEKIVATYSKDYIWIVDESKLSENLGSFKVPVEVIPYGSEQLFKEFERAAYAPTWRLNEEGEKLITDMQHFIIDLHIAKIENPQKLADELDLMVGVVEHGLFNDMVKKVIVAGSDGVKIISQ
ncbi:ribose-5-phosphate isomerase RpiA [Lactococcus cremoris]|jgi:ribose 5-phosphate isomerase A|uniref:Ribose-5-phosphate isomerase A n=1 Tax=Lactococcus cremoris subsp. cremoris IBB477 TaxID=1449093 RepID=A0A1E7G1C5_LACLC|nr:ribose-5-phosphate isomerase RpiA [Lactococcus cremoris]MCI1842195.1 ribose-5-phosphate isomerase RpiA [Lactococcus lactis]AGV74228.1 ribose 5-phosphate isomerase A RpiA [Lactococcus cremoris subsp. cremoris KW2]KZK05915.1 Ribose 5-phosphate isomerase A [Lactococcus cremoris]MCD6633232.1 ribose-5-phosphate isomerase RpiA [Lactococcus cremoris]MCT0455209.1 ribose-5-phosphate isomerase RpiA [Lactococcus cremoris]